ncbi:MAG: OOP family OmpA-OmpF porin [Candidatus Azotimanducaceae bacterium]|jgi:OOP family OmpA-OmpF porin
MIYSNFKGSEGTVMHNFILVGFTLFVFSAPLQAQSTLTLESYDLGLSDPATSVPLETESSALGDCLLAASECRDSQMKAGTIFSLEDVINLKVESNAGTAIVPASTGTQTSAPLQSIDMEILFDYNSDVVRPDQMNSLFELGTILKDDQFSGFTFLFVGHSDAKGSAAYNQDLSARRARAVSNFVQASARLSQDNFAASGMGFSRLKDRNDPLGPQNRRVQLVLVPK